MAACFDAEDAESGFRTMEGNPVNQAGNDFLPAAADLLFPES